jgi:type I restriction enzyme R subunit/putative DNA methylase
LLAFVIMPDHVHLAFVLGETRSLDQVVKGFASVTSREIIRSCALKTPIVWQEEYHDRWLRSDEMTWATLDYIHTNPARKGLCVAAEDWPWSTAAPRFRGWIEEDLLPT